MYADDTTLCVSDHDENNLFVSCNNELDRFYDWTSSNKLTIHLEKTNFMLFSNRIDDDHYLPELNINGRSISREKTVKFLGVFIDDKLKFADHIIYISGKVSKSVGILNSIKYFVPENVLKNLYYSFIYTYIQYCIVCWGGTYTTHLNPLRVAQKRAVRTVNRMPYLHPSNELFLSSNILKIDDVYKLKMCVYLFKEDLIGSFDRSHEYATRFRSDLLPAYQRLTNSRKSITTAGPIIWNQLPREIQQSSSVSMLKYKIKQFHISDYNEDSL